MHITVLRKVAVDFLVTNPSGYYLDVTGGAGGHAEEILKKLDLNGRLIVCDQDPKAVDLLSTKFSDSRVEVRRARFSEVFEKKENFDGILADLGISSNQLDDAQRGLSFLRDGPLDMRLNPNETETAAHVIMERSEEELANIFFHFGEEMDLKVQQLGRPRILTLAPSHTGSWPILARLYLKSLPHES